MPTQSRGHGTRHEALHGHVSDSRASMPTQSRGHGTRKKMMMDFSQVVRYFWDQFVTDPTRRRSTMIRTNWLVGAACIALLTANAAGAATAIKTSTTGTPKLQSIDVIRFAPEGVLLIGDGKGSQIVAVDTKDTQARPALKNAIDKIDEKLAGKIGATAKQIVIT